MAVILHIARRSDWERAVEGGWYEPPSLGRQGFVHCSARDQVLRVANALFRDERDLLLLTIDTERCAAQTRWEDLYAAGEEFPHVYGPIEVTAVVRVSAFAPSPNGVFEAFPGDALGSVAD